MRDIKKYTKDYTDSSSFENYQVKFRRKKVLEVINSYKPRSLLEIGCGLEPIGLYTKLEQYTICEPSKYFCDVAKQKFLESTPPRSSTTFSSKVYAEIGVLI